MCTRESFRSSHFVNLEAAGRCPPCARPQAACWNKRARGVNCIDNHGGKIERRTNPNPQGQEERLRRKPRGSCRPRLACPAQDQKCQRTANAPLAPQRCHCKVRPQRLTQPISRVVAERCAGRPNCGRSGRRGGCTHHNQCAGTQPTVISASACPGLQRAPVHQCTAAHQTKLQAAAMAGRGAPQV